MGKSDDKTIRQLRIAEVLYRQGTGNTMEIARALGLRNPNQRFFNREVRHIIGDMTQAGLTARTGDLRQSHGSKRLHVFMLTEAGRQLVTEAGLAQKRDNPVITKVTVDARPGVTISTVPITPRTPRPPLEQETYPLMAGQGNVNVNLAPRVAVQDGPRQQPTGNKIIQIDLSRGGRVFGQKRVPEHESLAGAKVVPLPEHTVPKTPAYPVIGHTPETGTASTADILRGLMAIATDKGHTNYVAMAKVVLEEHRRHQQFEALLREFAERALALLGPAPAKPKAS